jgi:hypothetical protein
VCRGGDGDDTIRCGTGEDDIFLGGGSNTFFALDGYQDTIFCGPDEGEDDIIETADPEDKFVGCDKLKFF